MIENNVSKMSQQTCDLQSPPVVHNTVGGLQPAMRFDGSLGKINHTTADILCMKYIVSWHHGYAGTELNFYDV